MAQRPQPRHLLTLFLTPLNTLLFLPGRGSSGLGLALSSTPESGKAYYWASKNGDVSRTGSSPHVAPRDLAEGPSWSYIAPLEGRVLATPLVDDRKNIYLSIASGAEKNGSGVWELTAGHVMKFSADGNLLWDFALDESLLLPDVPMLYDGSLYFGNGAGGEWLQLDMETSAVLARHKVADCSAGDTWTMTVSAGVIVMPTSRIDMGPWGLPPWGLPPCNRNLDIIAMDTNGNLLWNFTADFPLQNFLSAVVDAQDLPDSFAGHRLVFADMTGVTYALELHTGALLWKTAASPGNISFTTGGAVVGANGIVYTTSNSDNGLQPFHQPNGSYGLLTAFDLLSGEKLWQRRMEMLANVGAAVGQLRPDGKGPLAVITLVGDNPEAPPQKRSQKRAKVVAHDAATGESLPWKYDLSWSYSAGAGDTLDPPHVCLPDVASNPAISGDGTVYFGFEDGRVYALQDANSNAKIEDSEVSSYNAGSGFQGSPGIAPGMLVATPCNGMHVFSFQSLPQVVYS